MKAWARVDIRTPLDCLSVCSQPVFVCVEKPCFTLHFVLNVAGVFPPLTFIAAFKMCLFSIQFFRLIPSTLATKFLHLALARLNHFSTDGNHQGAHFNKQGAALATNGFVWDAAFKGAAFELVTVTEGNLTPASAMWGKKLFVKPSLIWKFKPVSASQRHYRVIRLLFTHFLNGAWKWQENAFNCKEKQKWGEKRILFFFPNNFIALMLTLSRVQYTGFIWCWPKKTR